MTIVVIFTPTEDRGIWLAKCAAMLDDLELTLHSTTQDYSTAARLVDTGEADAIFVARPDHVPHGPKVIVASQAAENPHGVDTVPLQDRTGRYQPPRRRRPKPLDGQRDRGDGRS